MALAGEALIRQAIDAQRRYHEAHDAGAPADEVERLRLLADSLFQTVTDYQLDAVGHQRQTRH
ncbi:hypothetical protein [Pseudomonas sp. NPDC089406]|uniref:hypothetical protein n=1 Tax=Pseudomonas sp. NPDC089406 TaxID=3364463 RepID=UPI00384BE515